MAVRIKVEKAGWSIEASLSPESILEFKAKNVDLVEDTKKYILGQLDTKIKNARGDVNATPIFTVTGR